MGQTLSALGIVDGPTTISNLKVRVDDGHGHSADSSATTLTVTNVAPTAVITGAPASSPEGTPITLGGAVNDPSSIDQAAGFTETWAVTKDGAPYTTGAGASFSFTPADNGSYAVTLTATDKDGGTGTDAKTITVVNVAPTATITGPASGAVFAVGTPVTLTGTFTDPGTKDAHTAQWALDNATIPGTVTESGGNGTVQATYTFTTPGVYDVTLTVADNQGGSGTANLVNGLPARIVVYDPSAGFVTGGGWVNSLDPTRTGKANFGFVAKYQKGATLPTGETEFQVADLNFHSTSYDWLVVTGAEAQFQGSGTINGGGSYGFLLTIIDGQATGGGGVDKLRMKIWDKATGAVVYDSQLGAPDSADPTTVLGGGSIVLHS